MMKYNALNVEEMKSFEKINELQKAYKDYNDDFKKEVAEITDLSDLEGMEKYLMSVMDEHDKYIETVSYSLPEEVEFEGDKYTRARISTMIKSFLERQEVEFTYTYGLYILAKFWASNPENINYSTLDTTLRLLEQLKYGGKDWKNILIINAFFQKSNEQYNRDMARTIFLAENHNIIMERMQLISPQPNANQTQE